MSYIIKRKEEDGNSQHLISEQKKKTLNEKIWDSNGVMAVVRV